MDEKDIVEHPFPLQDNRGYLNKFSKKLSRVLEQTRKRNAFFIMVTPNILQEKDMYTKEMRTDGKI